jgi:hypothetical protein
VYVDPETHALVSVVNRRTLPLPCGSTSADTVGLLPAESLLAVGEALPLPLPEPELLLGVVVVVVVVVVVAATMHVSPCLV